MMVYKEVGWFAGRSAVVSPDILAASQGETLAYTGTGSYRSADAKYVMHMRL